jgi:glutathione S-transferase
MIKLYGGAFSRAAIVKWYLEELQLPYEFIQIDLQAEAQRQSDYLAIHPFGKVPALTDGELTLWESGAILTYLASKHDKTLDTPEKFAIVNQWVYFANSTLGEGLFQAQATESLFLLSQLDGILAPKSYLIGETLTAADIAIASLLNYIPMLRKDFDYSPYPNVFSYLQRMQARPAFKATMTIH